MGLGEQVPPNNLGFLHLDLVRPGAALALPHSSSTPKTRRSLGGERPGEPQRSRGSGQ